MMAHERGSHSRISLPIRILEIGARFYAARAYFTPNIFTSTPATKECPWSLIGQRFIAIQHSFVLVASIFFPAKQCGGATKIPHHAGFDAPSPSFFHYAHYHATCRN